MFPICFVHGVHGVQHDPDADHLHTGIAELIAFRGRFVLAALTAAVVIAMGFAGCDGADRDIQATASGAAVTDTSDPARPEFDITLLDEFP